MKVYLTDSLDGRLSNLPLPAAITLRQVSIEQARKTVDHGAHGLFDDQEMAASIMDVLNRRITPLYRQANIAHGDQLLLATRVAETDSAQRGPRLMFYEVRIAR